MYRAPAAGALRSSALVTLQRNRSEAGFSLIEVLIAAGVLATALVGLAQLFGIAAQSNSSARVATVSAVLAATKLEELRSFLFAVDELGAPVGEAPSSSIDYLDRWGNVLPTASGPPAGAAYFRRWWVRQLPSNPSTLVVEVAAGPIGAAPAGERRRPDEVWFATAKTRKAR